MSCPICGANCRCRKRGPGGICCSCHRHKPGRKIRADFRMPVDAPRETLEALEKHLAGLEREAEKQQSLAFGKEQSR